MKIDILTERQIMLRWDHYSFSRPVMGNFCFLLNFPSPTLHVFF
jgi:hypothetical protein